MKNLIEKIAEKISWGAVQQMTALEAVKTLSLESNLDISHSSDRIVRVHFQEHDELEPEAFVYFICNNGENSMGYPFKSIIAFGSIRKMEVIFNRYFNHLTDLRKKLSSVGFDCRSGRPDAPTQLSCYSTICECCSEF